MLKRYLVVAAFAVTLLAMTGATAEANRGGGKQAAEPVLSVEAVPGLLSSASSHPVTVSGQHFRPNRDVLLYVNCGTNTVVLADRSGSFSFEQEFHGSGSCLLRAFQYHANRWQELATYTYTGGS